MSKIGDCLDPMGAILRQKDAEIARLRAALEEIIDVSQELSPMAQTRWERIARRALKPEATEGLTLPPRKNKTLADDLPGSY